MMNPEMSDNIKTAHLHGELAVCAPPYTFSFRIPSFVSHKQDRPEHELSYEVRVKWLGT